MLKNSDSGPVSNINSSQKIPSSGWGPGPGNLSPNGQKPTPLMTLPTKKPKLKKFFTAN